MLEADEALAASVRDGDADVAEASAFRLQLPAAGAWEVIEPATPEQKQYVNVVEEMAIAAGQPRPRIWIVPDPDPNAFATGRSPSHAAVAVTTGLLEKMNRIELEGVLAHELSHIKNYDILVSTLAVIDRKSVV